MSKINSLHPLPPLPSSSRRRPQVPCECGCGGSTQRRFVPGHDSRLRGWVIRVERGLVSLTDIASLASEGEAIAVANVLGLEFPETVEKVG